MRRDVRAGEPCTCGHPALVHRWDDAHACQAEGCPCTAYTRAKGERKYHNQPVVICVRCEHPDRIHSEKKGPCCADLCDCVDFIAGRRFDSMAECERSNQLMLLFKAGAIKDLDWQPRFELRAPSGKRIGYYVADFRYVDLIGETVVEDVKGGKGTVTALYRWKKKHFEAEYGIKIREIGA